MVKNNFKKCSKCGKIKMLIEFYSNKSQKDGYDYYCNKCRKMCDTSYYVKNKFKIKEYNKKHKKEKAIYDKNYRKNHREEKFLYYKKYYKENKEELVIYHKKYIKKWMSYKRKTDINFKLLDTLRNRINKALKNNYKKSKTTKQLLDCTIQKVRAYLQKQFTSKMSWKNYGSYWEIDHIKPCCKFDLTKLSEQKKCFHYTNLQPLTAKENRVKGGAYGNK